ncbi:MAG TPA: hypothetical protein V6C57_29215 [Coleofasciculaceae cyanobacterium]
MDCRFCKYYQPQGRRGGQCQLLEVPVQSHWKACKLSIRPFVAPTDINRESPAELICAK